MNTVYPLSDEKGNYCWRNVSGKRIKIYQHLGLSGSMRESGKFSRSNKQHSNSSDKELNNLKEQISQLEKQLEGKKFLETIDIRKKMNELQGKITEIENEKYKREIDKQIQKELSQNKNKVVKTAEQERNEYKKNLSGTKLELQNNSDKLYNGLTSSQKDALDKYTGEEYISINKEMENGNLSVETKQIINNIDSVMSKYTDNVETTYYRGTSISEVKGLKVGDNYSPKSYKSSSNNEKIAKIYADNNGKNKGVILTFNSKDLQGIYVGTNSLAFFNEDEFIIKHSQNFIVKSIYEKQNQVYYEMELKK